jgi:hypothetical protein
MSPAGRRRAALALAWGLSLLMSPAPAAPPCVGLAGGETPRAALARIAPADEELLARLVHAEGRSSGHADDPLVYQAIAWGVMSRVRLGEASPAMRRRYGEDLAGVVFRQGQFNPALSPRSPFRREFLCPEAGPRWDLALAAARLALAGRENPLVQTDWERARGLSLVVNFYYPSSPQARGPFPPWHGSPELAPVGQVAIGGAVLAPERVRMYRLTRPPADLDR